MIKFLKILIGDKDAALAMEYATIIALIAAVIALSV